MRYRYIFWDWNGTLLNDAQASCDAVNAMLSSRQLPPIDFELYREYIDVPIIRFYNRVLDMEKESMELLSVEFNTYVNHYLPENPLEQSTIDLIKQLHKNGIMQHIFSSSQTKLIVPYLERFGIDNCFDAVLGADDCYVESKIERTVKYIKENNISPCESLFIGDMAHDSDVADTIGADCILLSSGHQSLTCLQKTGRTVVESFSALKNILFI